MATRYKDTKIGRIPEEWDIVRFIQCLQKPKQKDPTKEPDEKFIYIDVSAVSNECFKIIESNTILGRDAPSRARKEIRTGDTIYATVRPYLKRVAFVPAELDGQICSTGYCVLRPKSEELSHRFVFQLMLTHRVNEYLKSLQAGTSYPAINDSDIYQMLIPKPPLPEQRKIAEILSTVDEVIEKTDAIIEETQQLKKGLMQKLFTEGIGHTRFKETKIGRIPEEWRAVQIGDFSTIRRGASPRPIGDTKYFAENGRGWVRIADVTSSNKKLQKTSQYLSELGVRRSVPVNPGDLIMSICATIGKPIIVDMEACIHDGFILFSKFHKVASTDYLYYLLQLLEESFVAKGQEGTQKNLNTNLVRKTNVPLPPLDEQRQIAEILCEVDTKIEAEQYYKAELEYLKKGLMHLLLTGQVRVKV